MCYFCSLQKWRPPTVDFHGNFHENQALWPTSALAFSIVKAPFQNKTRACHQEWSAEATHTPQAFHRVARLQSYSWKPFFFSPKNDQICIFSGLKPTPALVFDHSSGQWPSFEESPTIHKPNTRHSTTCTHYYCAGNPMKGPKWCLKLESHPDLLKVPVKN